MNSKIRNSLLILFVLLLAFDCSKKKIKPEEKKSDSYQNEASRSIGLALVIASELSIRKFASKTAERVKLVPFDSIVEILEESPNSETIDGIKSKWLKVKYEEEEGWVFGGYVIEIKEENMEKIDSIRWDKIEKKLLLPSLKPTKITINLNHTTWTGSESFLKCGSEGVIITKAITFLPNNKFKSEFDHDNYGSHDIDEGSGTYSFTDFGLILNYNTRALKTYQYATTENDRELISQEDIPDKQLILNYYSDLNGFIEKNNDILKEKSLYYEEATKLLATKNDMIEYAPCMEGKIELLWKSESLWLYYVIRQKH
ncbi:MAG: SH3 domain-containing protein [Leptospiraceae bacterium]|nr:SH3 domain-containing protein [Leptospiraceae bacterium]